MDDYLNLDIINKLEAERDTWKDVAVQAHACARKFYREREEEADLSSRWCISWSECKDTLAAARTENTELRRQIAELEEAVWQRNCEPQP